MSERELAILDRGVLTALVQARAAGGDAYKQAITSVCSRYKRILFEPVAMSALVGQLYEMPELEPRLMVLRDTDPLTTPDEARLIDAGMRSIASHPQLVHEQQRYVRKIAGSALGTDTLAYLVRLLLLSRKFDADIILWHARLDLLHALLEVTGISTSSYSVPGETHLLTPEPCRFPFLTPTQEDVHRPLHVVTFQDAGQRTVSNDEMPSVAEQTRTTQQRDLVFLSYSHDDRRWLDRFQVHLKPLLRDGSIQAWSDKDIAAGDEWDEEIKSSLARTRVAVLLVSPQFLASDYIQNKELSLLVQAAERAELRLLWVAVSASAYEQTALARYQATNSPDRPLDSMRPAEVNKAFVDICKQIKREFERVD